jgi:hypothetical protein
MKKVITTLIFIIIILISLTYKAYPIAGMAIVAYFCYLIMKIISYTL